MVRISSFISFPPESKFMIDNQNIISAFRQSKRNCVSPLSFRSVCLRLDRNGLDLDQRNPLGERADLASRSARALTAVKILGVDFVDNGKTRRCRS